MKRKILIAALVLLLIVAGILAFLHFRFGAASSDGATDTAAIVDTTVHVDIDSALVSLNYKPVNDGESPYFNVNFNVAYFKNCQWANKMNEVIVHEVTHAVRIWGDPENEEDQESSKQFWQGNYRSTGDLKATLQTFSQQLKDEYVSEFRTFAADTDAFLQAYTFEEETYAAITLLPGNIATWTGHFYFFSGGAHGMNIPLALTFDLTTGDTLGLYDFLRHGCEASIQALLKKKILAEAGASDDDELEAAGFWASSEDVNYLRDATAIYPDSDGLVFTYAPYAIACYAVGSVSVTLTWKELNPYLSPESPRVLSSR